MVASFFPIRVPRLCRVRSAEPDPVQDLFPLDPDGFRITRRPAAPKRGRSAGDFVKESELEGLGSLVLLGEPGAGKSSLLRALTADATRDDAPRTIDDADCLWVYAAEISEASYHDLLGSELRSLPLAPAVGASPGDAPTALPGRRLTVVVDQLDECPILDRLPGLLRISLKGRDVSGLRILAACRTASFKQSLADVLNDHFGACALIDLAPLSRSDAVALADSAGVSGEDMIKAVLSAKAGPLASVPLTLELLVRSYQETHRLDGDSQDLFARGTRLLATEYDPNRISTVPAVTTAEQRLVTAGRLAAWMLLSGRRSLWLGSGREESPHHLDLPVELAVGGTESTGPGMTFEVSRAVVGETLATGLFAGAGRYRTQFRHASLAAYLAARYLVQRGTRADQLADLFLVRSPDGAGSSIPAPLRETAAWIVALAPSETEWLAGADPASLVAHSAFVRSARIRELIVERLLARADEVELGDTRYYFARWDLDHPTLDAQLTGALATEPDPADLPLSLLSRVRVALRLAQDCPSPTLTPSLLRIAGDAHWTTYERCVAAFVAMDCNAAMAAPPLRELLLSLPTPQAATAADPRHALRGMLLSLLWPKYLTIDEVLSAMVAPPADDIGGDYARFFERMPTDCADDHLAPLLAWLDGVWQPGREGRGAFHAEGVTDFGTLPSIDLSAPHGPGRILDGALAQVMHSRDPQPHLPAIAALVTRRFQTHHKVLVPDALQRDSEAGTTNATDRRRMLAAALLEESVRQGEEPSVATWLIIREWERPTRLGLFAEEEEPRPYWDMLIDSRDFTWALARASEAQQGSNEALADAYGRLAAHLFEPNDQGIFLLAYENQENPVWPHVRWHYDPVALTSELATRMRRSFEANQPQPWEESEQFIDLQRTALRSLARGESGDFADFLYRLQFDPITGRAPSTHNADPMEWPGIAVFSAAEVESLLEYSIGFLSREDDRAAEWLGRHNDQRAWAGRQALVWLHKKNLLSDLPPAVWHSWSGAILGEVTAGTDNATEVELRRLAATHAPERFSNCLVQYVKGSIDQGIDAFRLEMIDPLWDDGIASAMHILAEELHSRLVTGGELQEDADAYRNITRTWATLLTQLVCCGRESPTCLAVQAMRDGASSAKDAERDTAVRAAVALLAADARRWWPEVRQHLNEIPLFSAQLARAAAHRRERRPIDSALAESELAEVYEWLDPLVGTEEPVYRLGSGFVGPNEEIRDWWASLPSSIASRGTAAAVLTMRGLVDRHPGRLHLQSALIASRTRAAAAARAETPLQHVIAVLADPDRRIVRTSGDLLDVVMSVLEQIKIDIQAHGGLLWDRVPSPSSSGSSAGKAKMTYTWRPKPEAALCAYLDHELRLRLKGNRVVVNREVMIQPTDAYGAGKRVDVLAQVHPHEGRGLGAGEASALSLVIK
ncbi:hypothetical protein LO772_19090 [Yinghuangia sp. ASG 101]|uniref:NACHT domain-containing protein n=1 Tax=Yinghuangia sp. ASG 101 TaxID=2896848 RepID=UPI001E60D7CD|nr:hypothetical protein [Yinghuangia sp. ASG 101]UGQ09073.1 hypothetical protein LO772_19090 [Yinghuangia sp. ASG 101]